jgi:hypothetical protein
MTVGREVLHGHQLSDQRTKPVIPERYQGDTTPSPGAHGPGARHRRVSCRPGNRAPAQRSAGDRDRMRAAVPTAPLHGKGHPRDGGRRGVPEATPRKNRATPTRSPSVLCSSGARRTLPRPVSARSFGVGRGGRAVEMIRENLVAERVAIESYSEIIRYIREGDPTSRRLMEEAGPSPRW